MPYAQPPALTIPTDNADLLTADIVFLTSDLDKKQRACKCTLSNWKGSFTVSGPFTPRQANRRYLTRFFPSMTAYVVLLLASNAIDAAWHPHGPALIALAVLPALPILAVIWAMGMAVVEQPDEYVRRNMIHAMLIATALMLAVTTVWSFLEDTGTVPAKPVHLNFPLWCAGLLAGQCWLWLRDRLAGERQ